MNSKDVIIKYGLIGGGISIIFGILSYLLNLTDSKVMQYLGLIIMLAVIILGLFEYRDKVNNGFASFGELFKVGFLIGIVLAVISALWTYVFVNFLDTEFISRTLIKLEMDLETQGLSEKDMKQAFEMTKKFMTPLYMTIMGFISTTVLGLIVTLISSLVIKNNQAEA